MILFGLVAVFLLGGADLHVQNLSIPIDAENVEEDQQVSAMNIGRVYVLSCIFLGRKLHLKTHDTDTQEV